MCRFLIFFCTRKSLCKCKMLYKTVLEIYLIDYKKNSLSPLSKRTQPQPYTHNFYHKPLRGISQKNPKWLFHLNSHVTADTYWLHYTSVSGISSIRSTWFTMNLIFRTSSSLPIYGKISVQLSRRVDGVELVSTHSWKSFWWKSLR